MSSYHYSFIFSHRFHCLGFLPRIARIYTELLAECVLPQISQIYTEVRLPSRGCTCLRSALPLARARSAPTKQEVPPEISRFCEFCVFCGRHFAVAEARIPPLLSSAPNKSVSICEICGRITPARVKSVGGSTQQEVQSVGSPSMRESLLEIVKEGSYAGECLLRRVLNLDSELNLHPCDAAEVLDGVEVGNEAHRLA